MKPAALWRAWTAHPDPLAAASNSLAAAVACNQPFYPLYVWWAAGAGPAGFALLTWLSTPVFALAPALSRRNSRAGRAMLPAAGAANTLLCAVLFGPASGVELFLVPCALAAVMGFRREEAALSAMLLGAGTAAALLCRWSGAAPRVALDPAQVAGLFWLNVYSVAGLTVLMIWSFAAARRAPQST